MQRKRAYIIWESRRTLVQSLNSTFRDRCEPDFNFSVCVIPWTDGNVYGISFHEEIKENVELLRDIADEYHYQNQTDQPDDISDEE